MMTTIETYVRKGQGSLRKWIVDPGVRLGGKLAGCFLAATVLSGASLANVPQPLAAGLVCALSGWEAVAAAAGGGVGYLLFWGSAGYQGLCWLILSLAAALALGKRRILEESPYLMMSIAGLIISASGLGFQLWAGDTTPVPRYLLRIGLGAGSAKLFELVRDRRDRTADWLALGCAVLSFSQIAPFGLSLGYVAAGALGGVGGLPLSALTGLALDLSRVTEVSMTAVLCIGYFFRTALDRRRWARVMSTAAVYLLISGLRGNPEILPALGLALGGGIGLLLPRESAPPYRRGETGLVQVRLELMAEALREMQQLLLEAPELPVDEEALLHRTRQRACGGCPNRKNCRERLNPLPEKLLHSPLLEVSAFSVACKKPGRLLLELHRTQEQLRAIRADRERQREYRSAVIQQYQFLGSFLQQQSDLLPRREGNLRQRFTPETGVCAAGKEMANGDRWAAFPGVGCRYYLVICDGMGTGLGAAQEGQSAVAMLKRMLTAGFPAEFALRSLNSLLVLRGRAAAVTVDLAEIRLDCGRAALYKWGAAPSWLLHSGMAEKIGTATPPPGLSVTEGRETVERLSLRRGEVLIMVSDGVQMDGALHRMGEVSALPPGEIAAKLLEYAGADREDDVTVAAVRLQGGVVST